MSSNSQFHYQLPNPFPVSSNLCTFQKGSGVSATEARGCEVPCLDPLQAADIAQQLFPSLDDQTVWTAQAAIVSECDECIYGPVEVTLRQFIANLKSICCIDDSCLVGIINAILCNPILNYRARFIEAQNAIAQVQQTNDQLLSAFAGAQAQAQTQSLNVCRIVEAVRQAISTIPQDGAQGSQIRCCLAACLQNLCQPQAGGPTPPQLLPLPCPCPPISCEALANACVVIKVQCPSCTTAGGGGVTCDDNIDAPCCDGDIASAGGTFVAGITYPSRCLLPTGADYTPNSGSNCQPMSRAVVLTFRGAQSCVSGLGVVLDDGFPSRSL